MKPLLIALMGAAAGLLLAASALAAPPPSPTPPAPTFEAVQRRAFDFFWNESDPKTGLTKDRAVNLGGKPDTYIVASTAATGYALAALPVGVSHGWVTKDAAYARALLTLRFVHDKLETNHGFYYHFLNKTNGERFWKSELSSIDTALLLLGRTGGGRLLAGNGRGAAGGRSHPPGGLALDAGGRGGHAAKKLFQWAGNRRPAGLTPAGRATAKRRICTGSHSAPARRDCLQTPGTGGRSPRRL